MVDNREMLIQSQITLIAILQDQLKEARQQLANEKNVRLQTEADNSRMWKQLYGVELVHCYREGSE